MQLTSVSAVPRYSGGAFRATNVENCGLSATTAAPQINRKTPKIVGGNSKLKTETRQQIPEIRSA